MVRSLIFLLFLSLHAGVVSAVGGGADTKLLMQMYQSMKEQIEKLKEQIETMKTTNDAIFTVRETVGDIKEQYDFVNGLNLDAEIQAIVDDIDDLTYMNELKDAKTNEQRYALLHAEIGKRFKRNKKKRSSGGVPNLEDDKSLRALKKLRDKFKEGAISNGGVSEKDFSKRTADATSLLASMALQQQIKQKEDELLKKEKLLDQIQWDANFIKYLKGKN